MAAPRLPFLWPFLYKAARPCPPRSLSQVPRRGLRSSTGRRQEISTQRYGTANEPPPQLRPAPSGQQNPSNTSQKSAKSDGKSKKEKEKDKSAKEVKGDAVDKSAISSTDPSTAAAPSVLQMGPPSSSAGAKPQQQPQKEQEQPTATEQTKQTAKSSADSTSTAQQSPAPKMLSKNPLEAVLNMPTSSSREAAVGPSTQPYYHENAGPDPDEHRPPHISTPRYVHHFDTYGLVNRLNEGGWSSDQAVSVMKSVRLILADNMELAREGLVSKSDVENETYLFRAACSELRTEVGMRRKAETEKSRSERTGLQHEVDILGQRVGMEAAGMREELKGMVEGRKMAVREEGRGVDSKIQELNYRITVALNSDLRSEVEGVRWIITKRAITALAICVLMVIAALKYASGIWQHEEEARKRAAAAAASAAAAANSSSAGSGGERKRTSEHQGTQTDDEFVSAAPLVVRQGDNPGFISLG